MDKKNIREATKVILNATDNETSALEKSFLLVASIEKEISRGCIHRNLKGDILSTTEAILEAMLTDRKVLLQVPRAAVTGRSVSIGAGTSSSSATSISALPSATSVSASSSTTSVSALPSATSVSIGAGAETAPNDQKSIFIKKEPIMKNQNNGGLQPAPKDRIRVLIARKRFIENVLSKTDDPIRIKDMNKALKIVKKDMDGLNDI